MADEFDPVLVVVNIMVGGAVQTVTFSCTASAEGVLIDSYCVGDAIFTEDAVEYIESAVVAILREAEAAN